FSTAAKFSINFIAKQALSISTTILQTNDMMNLFLTTNSTPTMIYLSICVKKAMQKKKAYAETIGVIQQQANLTKKFSESNIIIEKSSIRISNSIKKAKRGQLPKTKHYESLLESQ
ncbi:14173_t:CDS:2, partial [Dentiscutata heterogama]